MSNVGFSIVDGGYSPQEVDRYIEMLQQEYRNAVAWGQELESKLEEIKTELAKNGVYFTIDEDNQNEVIENIFAQINLKVNEINEQTEEKAKDIINKANEKGRGIVKQAMENSVELRTQNDLIMKNLKSISDVINDILSNIAQ